MSFGTMGIFWLILAAVMLVIELATVSLVSIWFVAGALVAALLAFYILVSGFRLRHLFWYRLSSSASSKIGCRHSSGIGMIVPVPA